MLVALAIEELPCRPRMETFVVVDRSRPQVPETHAGRDDEQSHIRGNLSIDAHADRDQPAQELSFAVGEA